MGDTSAASCAEGRQRRRRWPARRPAPAAGSAHLLVQLVRQPHGWPGAQLLGRVGAAPLLRQRCLGAWRPQAGPWGGPGPGAGPSGGTPALERQTRSLVCPSRARLSALDRARVNCRRKEWRNAGAFARSCPSRSLGLPHAGGVGRQLFAHNSLMFRAPATCWRAMRHRQAWLAPPAAATTAAVAAPLPRRHQIATPQRPSHLAAPAPLLPSTACLMASLFCTSETFCSSRQQGRKGGGTSPPLTNDPAHGVSNPWRTMLQANCSNELVT